MKEGNGGFCKAVIASGGFKESLLRVLSTDRRVDGCRWYWCREGTDEKDCNRFNGFCFARNVKKVVENQQ